MTQRLSKTLQNISLKNFDHLWERADLPKREALQNMIFSNGIYCSQNKEIRISEISPFFELIQSLSTSKGENVTQRVWDWNQILRNLVDLFDTFRQDVMLPDVSYSV